MSTSDSPLGGLEQDPERRRTRRVVMVSIDENGEPPGAHRRPREMMSTGEGLVSITGDANAMSSDVCEVSLGVGSLSRLLQTACMYFTRYPCIDSLYGRYEYPISSAVPTVSHDAYRLVRMEEPGESNGSSAAMERGPCQHSTVLDQLSVVGSGKIGRGERRRGWGRRVE
ncbi:hypothetical protein TWF718_010717 [Orbilia javanica]|uniref:Uncharacterized protein n=1 Tax=Orbilia javanica TaxID=47235 RepID=A0AAN8MRS4_9PEZI